MGTNNVRTNINLYSLSTTRLINVITTNLTRIAMAHSASIAMEAVNVGPSVLVYGDSSISASTGSFLFYSQLRRWDNLTSGFALLFIADATNGQVLINEYKA